MLCRYVTLAVHHIFVSHCPYLHCLTCPSLLLAGCGKEESQVFLVEPALTFEVYRKLLSDMREDGQSMLEGLNLPGVTLQQSLPRVEDLQEELSEVLPHVTL